MPFFLVAFSLLVGAWMSVALVPELVQSRDATADAEATSFITYHQTVADWFVRNGGASGPPSTAVLTFPPGYVLRPSWAHQVVAGRLYSYTLASYRQPDGFASAVAGVGSRACLSEGSGAPTAVCFYGAVPLPASVASAIAPGAILIVGR